jgi:hypothetical protein
MSAAGLMLDRFGDTLSLITRTRRRFKNHSTPASKASIYAKNQPAMTKRLESVTKLEWIGSKSAGKLSGNDGSSINYQRLNARLPICFRIRDRKINRSVKDLVG